MNKTDIIRDLLLSIKINGVECYTTDIKRARCYGSLLKSIDSMVLCKWYDLQIFIDINNS